MLAVSADHRDVQNRHGYLASVAAGRVAMGAQHSQLPVQDLQVGRKVAAVRQPGGDPQRAVARAADDQRHGRDGPRVAGRLRQ
jgi:hypothetical protein